MSWAKNERKVKRQSGQEYTTLKGVIVQRKTIKLNKDCEGKCRFKCSNVIPKESADKINKEFWSLTDDKKYVFSTTERRGNDTKKTNSGRKFTYTYYLLNDNEKFRVC